MHIQTNISIYKQILSNTVIYILMQANTIQIHSYTSTYTQIYTYTSRYKLNRHIQDNADPIGAGAVGPFAENVEDALVLSRTASCTQGICNIQGNQ